MRQLRPVQLSLLFILAALSLVSSGCRTDQASSRSSELDSSNGAPVPRTMPESISVQTAPAPSQPISVAQDSRPRIVCFGDSLTAGYGTDPGQAYPDYLQSLLDAEGYHYRVVNQGVSGNTTKDGVGRLPNVLALHPDIVIVEFGGNDGLRGLPIDGSRANLDKIISTLKVSGTKVVIAGITLPPDYGSDYIKQFNETYTLIARKYSVPLLPFILKDVFGTPGMMQPDRTHATAAGNKIVASNVLPLIKPLLKK